MAVRRKESLMWKLVGSRRGASLPSRAGDVLEHPLVWVGFTVALWLTGPRGRRAALRGAACSAAASLIHLPIKRVIARRRPRGSGMMGRGPLTTSFPSGHTASDLSFILGAAQELPVVVVPLAVATAGSHWSLIRAREDYPSDVIAGGAIAFAVSAAAWKIRLPTRRTNDVPSLVRPRADGLRAAKRAAMRFVTNRLVNPITRPLLEHGLWPRTQALLETAGRTSGLPRRVPVGNGLRGDSFWIVTEHGYAADYVKNIQSEPRVRVKVGRHWREGTAHILPDDDPLARLRWLRRPVNDAFLLLIGTQQLTVRVDLDP